MTGILLLLAALLVAALVYMALQVQRRQKQKALEDLDDLPFDTGQTSEEKLYELKEAYESKKDLDQLNKWGGL